MNFIIPVEKNILLIMIICHCTFQGLTHPMIETDDGKFVPNFKFRYLFEDVPFGLAVIKGIADLAEVKTPNVDKVKLR